MARIPVEISPGAKASPRPTGLSLRENLMNHQKERTQMAGAHKVPGALSASDDWNAIDWRSVEREVRRLQMRIAKAEKEKRAGKVKALQCVVLLRIEENVPRASMASCGRRRGRDCVRCGR